MLLIDLLFENALSTIFMNIEIAFTTRKQVLYVNPATCMIVIYYDQICPATVFLIVFALLSQHAN